MKQLCKLQVLKSRKLETVTRQRLLPTHQILPKIHQHQNHLKKKMRKRVEVGDKLRSLEIRNRRLSDRACLREEKIGRTMKNQINQTVQEMLHPEDHEAVAQAEKDKQVQVSKKGKVESDQIHFLAIKMMRIQIGKLTQVHLTSILMNQDIAYVTKYLMVK